MGSGCSTLPPVTSSPSEAATASERTDVGVGATPGATMMMAGVGGWRRSGRDETRPSITAAGWGCGAPDGAFGGSSFAVGTSDGVVRVYGPGA